ncbi:hypothetical protein ACJMK2_036327 [Sinanodonta woodiana]|uniref:Ribosomal protein L33 n=1 Tax=Sinanodonta woodiana TaxID=1069815 RepID=A0ABD3WGW0_SINWO
MQSAQANTYTCRSDKKMKMRTKIRNQFLLPVSINHIEVFVFKMTVKIKKQQRVLDFEKKP